MQFTKNETPNKPSPMQDHHFDDFQHSQKQNITSEIHEPTTTMYNITPNQVRIEHYANYHICFIKHNDRSKPWKKNPVLET